MSASDQGTSVEEWAGAKRDLKQHCKSNGYTCPHPPDPAVDEGGDGYCRPCRQPNFPLARMERQGMQKRPRVVGKKRSCLPRQQ